MYRNMKCHIYDVSYTEMTTNTRYIQECMTTEWSGPWNIILYYHHRIVIGIMRILHKNRITSILFGSQPTINNLGPPTFRSPDLRPLGQRCTINRTMSYSYTCWLPQDLRRGYTTETCIIHST
jgi:hypothetical protein